MVDADSDSSRAARMTHRRNLITCEPYHQGDPTFAGPTTGEGLHVYSFEGSIVRKNTTMLSPAFSFAYLFSFGLVNLPIIGLLPGEARRIAVRQTSVWEVTWNHNQSMHAKGLINK